MPHWLTELRRLAREEEGQDLVEYAFLTLFVAASSVGVFITLRSAIGAAYGTSSTKVDALSWPPDPK